MLIYNFYRIIIYSLKFLLFISFCTCFFNINLNCFDLILNTQIYYNFDFFINYFYKYFFIINVNTIIINCFFIEILLFFCGLFYIKLVIRALKRFEHETLICQHLIIKIKFHLLLVGFFFFNPVLYQTLAIFGNNFFVISSFIIYIKLISYIFYLLIFFFIIRYCQKNNLNYKIEFFFLYYFIFYFSFIIYHIANFLLLLICLETIFFCLVFIFTGLFFKKGVEFIIVNNSVLKYNQILSLFFYKTNNYFSIYGTLIYFIYNAFALAFYLLAMLFFFIMSINLNFFDFFLNFRIIFINNTINSSLINIHAFQLNTNILLFICFIFFCFFLFKLGIFPFHFWVVKILMSLNYISLIILFIPYKLIIYFFFLIIFYKISNYIYLQFFFFICSAISIIIGAFGMYLQYNIRKFIAYSTITHAGYILSVLACGTYLSFKSTILYIIIYVITMYGVFLIVSFSKNLITNKNIISFLELGGIATNKLTIWKYFIIILFSMIGIPPLAGFWAKIGVLESLLQLNTWLSNFLILIIILTTAFTTIGYLRIIKLFFIKNVYNINLNKIGLYNNFIYLQIYFCIFFLIFFPIIWNILLQFFDFNEFYLFIFF